MKSDKYDLMSKPLSFSVFAGSLACVLSRDFNIRYFLIRCLSGFNLPYRGRIFMDGTECRITSVSEAHRLGIYDADIFDVFTNMNVGLNILIPDVPMYGAGLSMRGPMYDEVKGLLDEFEIEDINPYMLCGELNDLQKQLIMLLRSYKRGAKLILFNFFANYSYSPEELKRLGFVFEKLREKGTSVLCFSSAWMQSALGSFDRYVVIEDNVIVKNAARNEFTPETVEDADAIFNEYAYSAVSEAGEAVFSCRDFYYKSGARISFDLNEESCLGIHDSRQELLPFKKTIEGVISGREATGYEQCITYKGEQIYKNKDLASKVAFLDYGFLDEKSFSKLSLYDNITVKVGGAMYNLGFIFNGRIQKFIVTDLLQKIDRLDLLELYGEGGARLDNLDPEDQFVIEICRWLCIRPKVFIFHNFNRNYSLLSSEKVGNLIHKINTQFKIPVLIISPGLEELNFFCTDIIKL